MSYFIIETFRWLRDNWLGALVTVICFAVGFLILNLLLLARKTTERALANYQKNITLTVILSDEPAGQNNSFKNQNPESIKKDSLVAKIARLATVASIEYQSKEQALQELQKTFDVNVYEGLGFNPLPASLELRLKPAPQFYTTLIQTVEQIRRLSGVQEVLFPETWVQQLESATLKIKRIGSVGSGILIVMVLGLLFTSVQRLWCGTFTDLKVPKLLGASWWFSLGPYLLAGALIGLVGGSLALLLEKVVLALIASPPEPANWLGVVANTFPASTVEQTTTRLVPAVAELTVVAVSTGLGLVLVGLGPLVNRE